MSENLPSQNSSRFALMALINGYRLSQLAYVAAELGIADLLKDGPKHYRELAKAGGVDPDALYRCLRALASAGVFNQLGNGRFELNPLAEHLRRYVPGSLRAWAILQGQQGYPAWIDLMASVRTGRNAFEPAHGMSAWEYRAKHPDWGRVFNEAMSAFVLETAKAVVASYDFSRFKQIVDVGGGQGVLIATILETYPSANGVLLDLHPVVQGAQDLLRQKGVLDRCKIVAGDIFDRVPEGGDAYILSHVLLDWDDDHCLQILTNCRRAMKEGQTLFVIQEILDPEHPTVAAALLDIQMMVVLGGRERTGEEYANLLTAAGFRLTKIVPTKSEDSILEAIAA